MDDPHFSDDTKDFISLTMPLPFSTGHTQKYVENVDEYLHLCVCYNACSEVNNDKQEVEWISYDVCPSKLGQLSECARRGGQVLLPLIYQKNAPAFMPLVLRRTLSTEDVSRCRFAHCYCARL